MLSNRNIMQATYVVLYLLATWKSTKEGFLTICNNPVSLNHYFSINQMKILMRCLKTKNEENYKNHAT